MFCFLADVVNLLLEAGVEVDITGPDNRTALRAASWAGHADIVHRLLAAGADVNRPDAEGRTPLIAAAYMGCVDIIDILADAGKYSILSLCFELYDITIIST